MADSAYRVIEIVGTDAVMGSGANRCSRAPDEAAQPPGSGADGE